MSNTTRQQLRARRHRKVRARIIGTAKRPRLSVFRSLRGVYLQLVNDETGTTLVSVNSKEDKVAGDAGERKGKVAEAYLLGKALAEKATKEGITTSVFDRGGYKYHGRVQAVADGARDGGLKF